jgi:hypothetical protein
MFITAYQNISVPLLIFLTAYQNFSVPETSYCILIGKYLKLLTPYLV